MEKLQLDGKNESELQKLLKAEREKLRDLRFRLASRQLKDVRDLRTVRKTVARILTTLNARKRGSAVSKPPSVAPKPATEKKTP